MLACKEGQSLQEEGIMTTQIDYREFLRRVQARAHKRAKMGVCIDLDELNDIALRVAREMTYIPDEVEHPWKRDRVSLDA